MDRKDDTMNLDAIKDLLGDAPEPGDMDLDSILAEFEDDGPTAVSVKAPVPGGVSPDTNVFGNIAKPAGPSVEFPSMREPEHFDMGHIENTAMQTITPPLTDMHIPDDEEEAEEAYDDYSEEPRKKKKLSRKERKAAKRAAELEEEEEEDIDVRDPMEASQALRKQGMWLSFRSLIVLVIAVAAAYLSIAPRFEVLPLPLVFDVNKNPSVAIGALILLQFAALFIGIDVFGMGFSSLFHGAPDRASLVSFAILAGLLYAASIIVLDNETGVEIPYIALNILMLYASMRDERGRLHAQSRAYKAISGAQDPKAVYSHYDSEDESYRAVKGPLHDGQAFILELERADTVDRFSMVYVPLALVGSIVLAGIASWGNNDPMRMFWALSALLSVSAPVGMLCAFGASYKNVSKKLQSHGAAIAGARQAQILRGTEEVVLSETDLYPAGSVSLDSMQNLSSIADGKVLACAAALTEAAGLELGRVLSETTKERYGMTFTARNVKVVDGGITGRIGASNVVVGSAALMVKMGVRTKASQDDNASLYLVIDNTLAGIFSLRYEPTKNTYQAMRLMRRMHMNAVLAARDFNISPAMVEQEFELHRGFADQPDVAAAERLLDPDYTKGDSPAAILSEDGAGPFMKVLRYADKLAGAVRSALTLSAVAGIFGMAIVFYLVFNNSAEAIPVMNLLLYNLIWYIPVFLIVLQTH